MIVLEKEFIESMQNRYMVLEKPIRSEVSGDGESQEIKTFELQEKMLSFNNPDGLLKFELHQTNNKTYYHYDIGGMHTLEEAFKKTLPNSIMLKRLISSIISTILRGKEYFLEEDDFVISPEFIYCKDNAEQDIRLCYYPGYAIPLREQIYRFFEGLMNTIDYKDDKAVVYVYGMYRRARETGCTFDDLLQDFAPEKNLLGVGASKVGFSEEDSSEGRFSGERLSGNEFLGTSLSEADISEAVMTGNKMFARSISEEAVAREAAPRTAALRGRRSGSGLSERTKQTTGKEFRSEKQSKKASAKNSGTLSRLRKTDGASDNGSNKTGNISKTNYLHAAAGILIILLVAVYAVSNNLFISASGEIDVIKLLLAAGIVALAGFFAYKSLLAAKNNNLIKEAEKTEYKTEYRAEKKDKGNSLQNPIQEETYNNSDKESAYPSVEHETVFLSREKETVLLEQQPEICYYFEPLDGQHAAKIYPDKYPYCIGSSKEHADGIIPVDTISRRHARLEMFEEGLYIRDLDSKNGTYVNESRLCAGEIVRLMPDDIVMLANKKYKLCTK